MPSTDRPMTVRSALRLWLCTAALSLAIMTGGTSSEAASVYPVHNGDSGITTLVFRGQIVDGDLARLQRAVAKVAAGQRIALILESPGGSINEGISIGRYVYASRYTTIAIQGSGCHSACTFVFLAGRDANEQPMRIMMKSAKIGFHQGAIGTLPTNVNYTAADIEAATEFGQEMVRRVNSYLQEIKADPEFLTMMLSASHRSIALLNEFDALRLGIYVMDPTTQKLTTPSEFKK